MNLEIRVIDLRFFYSKTFTLDFIMKMINKVSKFSFLIDLSKFNLF